MLILERLTTPWVFRSAPPEDFARILELLDELTEYGVQRHGDCKPAHVFDEPGRGLVLVDPPSSTRRAASGR